MTEMNGFQSLPVKLCKAQTVSEISDVFENLHTEPRYVKQILISLLQTTPEKLTVTHLGKTCSVSKEVFLQHPAR